MFCRSRYVGRPKANKELSLRETSAASDVAILLAIGYLAIWLTKLNV